MFYERNSNYVLRKIHDTFFLIDITDNYNDEKCHLIETNEIGKFIWDSLGENNTIEQLTEALKNAITDEVPYILIYQDVTEYINILVEKGIVIRGC